MGTTIGEISVIAKIDTSQYKKGAGEIDQANKNMEDSGDKTSSKLNSGFSKVAKVGLAALATAAVSAGAILVKNIGNAVQRIDALVAFPKVLQAMGISANKAEKATSTLSDRLQGLPTSLQDATKGVQGLVSAGVDVDSATESFLALNNAMLAGGTNAQTASATMMQLNQAVARGQIEGQEWNSIIANMPTALQGLVKSSGKSREELEKLYKTNPQALLDDLVRLNKKGSGEMASLDEQARKATGGIATSWDNLNNAVTRGWESIVKTIGGGELEAGQKKISDVITSIGVMFEDTLETIGKTIKYFTPQLKELGKSFSDLWQNSIKPLLPIVGALLVGAIQLTIGALNIIIPLIDKFSAVTGATIGALIAFKVAMGISSTVTMLANSVKALTVAMTFLAAHPIVAVIAALGLVIGAVVGAAIKTDSLKAANDRVRDSFNQAKDASMRYKDAQLELQGSNLAVERAQKTYTETVRQYGKKSLEAREAALNLKRAEQQQKKAVDESKKAIEEKQKAQENYAKEKKARLAVIAYKDSLIDLNRQLSRTGEMTTNLGTALDNLPLNKKITVSADFIGPIQKGQVRKGKVGNNAEGTDNWRGGLTWVGEDGPEILNLPRGSQIIPNDEAKKINNKTFSEVKSNESSNQPMPQPIVNLRSSQALEREIAMRTIELVNQVYRSRGQQEIGVQF